MVGFLVVVEIALSGMLVALAVDAWLYSWATGLVVSAIVVVILWAVWSAIVEVSR